ncbi:MAG TPA: terminase [Terriglobales bacterium]|nr:terminase [Terriglobales bacterium]
MTPKLTPEYLEELGQKLDELRKGLRPGREDTERDCFIEEFLKIRTKTANRACFKLNRAQEEYSWVCWKQKAKKNVVLKARQVGITTYVAARFFTQTIAQPGTLSMQVTQDRESAEDIFRIVRRFWENLPDYARKGILKTSYRNTRQLVFPRLDSEYCLASAAENAGRGRTIQNLHCSEVSRWGREGDEALASLRAAVVPGGDIVLESTPNGAGGLFYQEWQRAEDTGYTRHFFPWWFDAAYVLEPGANFAALTEEERELAALHGLKPEQIAWRRKQWASLRGLAVQEFAEDPVSCFRASGECVFDLGAVEQALRGSGEPVEARDNQRLMIWLPTRPGREYVIGVDPAGGGVEGDYSCAEVIDRELGTQCAEWHGHWPPRELALKLVELGKEYNTALLAVERNNHGYGVLACLRTLEYQQVYTQKGQDGWLTSAISRPAMIENLAAAMMEEAGLFRSPRLLNECRTFVRYADGNTGAALGTHDDCVMALAIAWAVRKTEAGRESKHPVGWGRLSGK